VVKNLVVGEDVSYERKIREMIVASRLQAALSKDQILELYLNSVYLGRARCLHYYPFVLGAQPIAEQGSSSRPLSGSQLL
jgi:hypothetical protein